MRRDGMMGGIQVLTRKQAVAGLGICLVLLLLPGVNLPTGRWNQAIWDSFHAPLFFGITCFFYHLLPQKGGRGRRVLAGAFLAFAAGGLVEVSQIFFGRSPSPTDFVINVVGISFATVWLQRGSFSGKAGKSCFFVSAAVALWLCLWPAWSMTMAEALHRRHFPEIGAFSHWAGSRLWRAQGNAVVEFPEKKHRLKVTIGEGSFGGVSFRPGVQNWSGYENLELAIFNPDTPFLLGIRIDDSNSQRSASWYSAAVEVAQGASRLQISLRERSKNGKGEEIDLSMVERLALFTVDEIENREFFVDSAFLRP